MVKRLITILIISLLFVGCMNLVPISHKKLIRPYPTSHIFDLPVDSLKNLILSNFSVERQMKSRLYNNLIFYYNIDLLGKETKMIVTFATETSKDRLFSKDFFSSIGTDNDIYLHSFGKYWYSPIYYALGKPLEFRAQFRFRLIPINNNQTKLIVEIENPRVIKGIGGIGPHGFYSKEIKVKSTTIEEYSLIFYLAVQIGDTTLLPLDLDKNIK
jgi:hypothetical protein